MTICMIHRNRFTPDEKTPDWSNGQNCVQGWKVLTWNSACLCNNKTWTNRFVKFNQYLIRSNPWLHCAFLFFSFRLQVLQFLLFELQSRWIAMALSGRVALPSVAEMLQSVEASYAKLEASGKSRRSAHNGFEFQVKPGPLLLSKLEALNVVSISTPFISPLDQLFKDQEAQCPADRHNFYKPHHVKKTYFRYKLWVWSFILCTYVKKKIIIHSCVKLWSQ